jgi:3-oxoadipate enol-lactonase
MAITNINGLDIYYELHGQGNPLVLIAGYTCDHTFWGEMLDELTKAYQVLIFDNRGVGQTKDANSSFTLETMAEDTMTLVQQLGLVHPHILGQSMGGAIAQLIAKKYADKINKLIILNSVAKFNIRTIQALESQLNLRKENVLFDLLIESSMPWFFSSDYLDKPENITAFKEIVQNNPSPQSIQDQERQFTALRQFDSRGWLQEIKTPTLIISAEEDIVCLPVESQQLANNVLNAQFITIPYGHSSPLEQPSKVNKALLQFLA